MSPEDAGDLLPLGVVVGTHGLRGDLRVRAHSGSATALLEARRVYLARDKEVPAAHEVDRARLHKGAVLLRLQGVETLEAATSLRGSEVLVRREDLAELPEDEFYWFELQGLTVIDRERGEIGVLEEMLPTAAYDIYVVRGRFGEVLVPAVGAFVTEIDPPGGRLVVDLPEGLVPRTDDV